MNWREVAGAVVSLSFRNHTLVLTSPTPFMSAVIHNPRDTLSSMQ